MAPYGVSKCGHFPVFVSLQFQHEADVVVRVSGCYMKMKMEDRLACDTAVIREEIVSLKAEPRDEGGRDLFRCCHE